MVVAWHDAAFTLPDATLRPEVMINVLHKFKLQHKLKATWTKQEAMIMEKQIGSDGLQSGSVDVAATVASDESHHVMRAAKRIEAEIEQDRIRIK